MTYRFRPASPAPAAALGRRHPDQPIPTGPDRSSVVAAPVRLPERAETEDWDDFGGGAGADPLDPGELTPVAEDARAWSDAGERAAVIQNIIAMLESGASLDLIERNPELPRRRTIIAWSIESARLGELVGAALTAEALETARASADDYTKRGMFRTDHVARAKLKIETILRLVGKISPTRLGDRVQVDVRVDIADRLAKARARVAARNDAARTIEGTATRVMPSPPSQDEATPESEPGLPAAAVP